MEGVWRIYEETRSWADNYWEHCMRKEVGTIKASETQKLQRLADNLIDEEADANNKVKQSRPDLPKEALRILVRCRIKYKTWSQVS
jgi:hypothetical protein